MASVPDIEDGDPLEDVLNKLADAPPISRAQRGHLRTGAIIDGNYRIERRVGRGGMGAVYLATDLNLNRTVAVKLCLGEASRLRIDRLLREAQTMARLSHPNVLTVFQVGTVNDALFIAMEYVDGGTAREWLSGEDRTWREIVGLYLRAGRGLEAAHEVGIVHRDFKADNVLCGSDGRVLVADFGLARADVSPDIVTDDDSRAAAQTQTLTQTGVSLGTPAYMAPEQHGGGEVDPRADQFAFCAALYEALFGALPFKGATRRELVEAQRSNAIEPPSSTPVPTRIRKAVERGLRYDPDERWPTMAELLAELAHDPARVRRRLAATAGAVTTIGVVAVLSYRAGSPDEVCRAAADEFAQVWSPAAMQRIRAAFERTGVPAAAQAWGDVVNGVDEYRDAWVASRTRACEATHVAREQSAAHLDLRVACLARRLEAVRSLVGVLTEADAATIERGREIVEGLPNLSPCENAAALESGVEPPTEAQMEAVAALRAEVTRAQTLVDAGRAGEALARVREALAAADAVGYEPVAVEARAVEAVALAAVGDSVGAMEAIRVTYFAAVRLGHDSIAMRVALTVAELEATNQDKLGEALLWIDNAEAIAGRLGLLPTMSSDFSAARGRVALLAGDYTRAEAEFDAAVESAPTAAALGHAREGRAELLRLRGEFEAERVVREELLAAEAERGGHDGWRYAVRLSAVSTAEFNLGDTEAAARHLDEARAILERTLGPASTRLADLVSRMGVQANGRGEVAKAAGLYEEALAILQRVPGGSEESTINVLNNLAGVRAHQGDDAAAVELYEQALALAEEALGPRHRKTAAIRLNLAGHLPYIRGWDATYRELEKAIASYEEALGPATPGLLVALLNLAGVQRQQRRYDEAFETLTRADEIAHSVYPGEHLLTAAVQSVRGLTHLDLERFLEAEEGFERCAAQVARVAGHRHPDRFDCLERQVRARLGQGKLGGEPLQQALALAEIGSDNRPERIASLYASAATDARRRGKRAEAKAFVRLAEEQLRPLGPDSEADEIRARLNRR